MTPNLVICNGIFRSGSTWSFNVARLLAKADVRPVISGCISTEELDPFMRGQIANPTNPAVVKVHFITPFAIEMLKTGQARSIFTIRDPRDCVASDMQFLGLGIDASIPRIQMCLKILDSCRNAGNTLFIRYEQMMSDSKGSIRQIAAHLNIPVDDAMVDQINRQTNVESSRRLCQDLKSRSDKQITQVGQHKVDLVTNLHENHIASAKSGRWKDDLTAEQANRLTEIFQPWIKSLGYELK